MEQETIDIQNEFSFLGKRYRLPSGKVQSVSINGQTKTPDSQGNVDLGNIVGQRGPKGDTVVVGGEQTFSIANNFDGGENDALSGAMGKVVAGREVTDRQRIDEIVAILKKAVFTESVSFANLDVLATATDSIYLDKSSYAFNGIGGTMRLTAHVDPSTATSNIEWSSSNTSVATVTSDGTVVAIADGSAVITASDTISGKTATCAISVQQFVPNSVTISQATINSDGEHWKTTKQLTASTDPAGGTISWSILPANSSVATVNNGLVTLLANGQCTVRASCSNKYADCAVTVQNLVRTSYSIAKTLENASVLPNDANVLEGEDITLTITADASHVFASAADVAVTMNNVAQTVTIASDNKSATCSINNVSGNIAIVATATFVETNLMDGATAIQGTYIYGDTIYENQGAGYISKRVRLEKGKFYKIKNYSPTGTSGFDALLLKDDGNGGYERVTTSDIDTSVGLWALNNSLFRVNNNSQVYYRSFGTSYNYPYSEMVFGTPTEDELPDVDIYLFIDTKNGNNVISSDFGLYEWSPKTTLDFTELYGNWTPRANNYTFGESYGTTAVIKLTKGATYTFDGYTQFAQTTNNVFALLRKVDGVFKNLTSADLANGVNWNGNNGFFVAASNTNIGKTNVPLSGSFTVPSDSDVAGDLYLAVAVSSSASDSVASTLTITKQTQS